MMGTTRRNGNSGSAGFSIVELAIIIIIVGILIAVTTVTYNGLQNNAHNATLQSDLHTAANELATDRVDYKAYPLTIEAANGGDGLSKTEGTIYSYTRTDTTYCLQASSAEPGTSTYKVTQLGKIEEGTC